MWLLILGVACCYTIVHICLQGDIVHHNTGRFIFVVFNYIRTGSNDVYSEVIVSVAVYFY